MSARSSRRQLCVQSLESRETPANSLSITSAVSVGIAISDPVGGVVTIQTNLPSAQVSKGVLFNALNTAGVNEVVVTTSVAAGGTDGNQAGDVTWDSTALSQNIDGLTPGKKLTIRPDSTGTSPSVRFTGSGSFAPLVDNNSGTLEGLTLQIDAAVGNVHLGTDVVLGGIDTLVINGNIVGGGNDLDVHADTLFELNGNATGLGTLTLADGLLDLGGANTIGAVSLAVNNGATLAGSGPIGAAVLVNPFGLLTYTGTITGSLNSVLGTISPAGDGTVGALFVDGPIDLDDRTTVFLNLGASSDSISATGNVDVAATAGNENTLTGIGALPSSAGATLLSYGGTLTGTFGNIPNGTPAVLGTEAVTANYGTGANSALSVVQVPGLKTISTKDFDGTAISIKLSGPGEVAFVTDAFFSKSLVVRNTTAKSKLFVGTKPVFGSSGQSRFFSLAVNGTIGAIQAPKISFDSGGIRVLGTVKSIKILDLIGVPRFSDAAIEIGGNAVDKTIIQARDMNFARIESTGQILQLKTRGDFVGHLSAAGFGSISAGDQFIAGITTAGSVKSIAAKAVVSANGGSWQIGGSLGRLTAGQIDNLQVTANFLGSLIVRGNPKLLLAGTIADSNFTLLGNSGIKTKSVGLRSVNVKGTISNTTFDVREGNVGAVSAARFVNSNLWIDYTPGAPFNTGGTFGANRFKLGSFRTRAPSFIDPSGAKIFSFVESQIAASTIGSVNLTSLNTDSSTDTAFGIKFADSLKSLKTVKETSNNAIPLKTKLAANTVALADDFFVIDV